MRSYVWPCSTPSQKLMGPSSSYIMPLVNTTSIFVISLNTRANIKKITKFTNNGTRDLSHQAWWKPNTKYLTIFRCRVVYSYIRMDKYIYIYTWLSMYIRSTYIYIYCLKHCLLCALCDLEVAVEMQGKIGEVCRTRCAVARDRSP